MINRRHTLTALGASVLGHTPLSWAQEPYPNKAITMIVPFPPGGLADIVARPVAEAVPHLLRVHARVCDGHLRRVEPGRL